jgi:hypothetical protein
MPKRVCCDCVHSIFDKDAALWISDDGACWNCSQFNWQDESVCLACTLDSNHGCRGWGAKCSEFTRRL